MNKKQIAIMENWERSTATDLDDVYASYSYQKRKSFNDIWFEYSRDNYSHDLKILSYNTFMYTCCYLYDVVDESTGEVLKTRCRYFIPSHTEDFDCTEWYDEYLKKRFPVQFPF